MDTPRFNPNILIIDDDEQIRNLLVSLLSENYECKAVSSAEEAIQILSTQAFSVVISDVLMNGMSGLELVPLVTSASPETVVMMVSGQQTMETAIEAMRAGAFDYIVKPPDLLHVETAVRRAVAHHKLLVDKKYYETHLEVLVRKRSAEVERLAYFDTLTNLPNKSLFTDRVTQSIKVAERDGQTLGVVLLRVDQFRNVDDTLGQSVTDRLARDVAEKIRTFIGEENTVSRFEGDEFALLLPDIGGSEKILDFLFKLFKTMDTPFISDNHQLYITVSAGVSMFPVDGSNAEELLKNAGAALNRAVSQGGNSYQFYQRDMNARARQRMTMETELRHAIENDELVLHYQPQIDLVTKKVIGAEALVRWQHPTLGLLPPSEFIPLAEETGQILAIGDWCLRAGCAQAARWHRSDFPGLRVAINVAPEQFQQASFVETVATAVRESNVDPTLLELEITESSLMRDATSVIMRLSALKEAGVSIAIDDFGVGYSSLMYLKRLPIDMLKIDRTFVNDATTDPDDAALVMAIITLAHNLRLKVLAEGVETEEQLRFLRLLRCDEAQGYFFSKPLPVDLFQANLPFAQDVGSEGPQPPDSWTTNVRQDVSYTKA